MTDAIRKALQIWPETKAEQWSMRGETAVHQDARVSVQDSNLRGGFIRSGTVSGDARVYGCARVFGDAEVSGCARVYGSARVYGGAWVYDSAEVYGCARVSGSARVYGSAEVFGSAEVYDSARVYGDVWVYDSAEVYGCARVYDSARVYGGAEVFGSAEVSGCARVYGGAWVSSPVYIQGSRHALMTCSATDIYIGCENHSHADWLANYRAIGAKNGYSPAEVEEYGILIRAAILALAARAQPPERGFFTENPE